jgi:hypothetical protein
MNETMRESLSALMDDESNELELERILSRSGTDQELRRTWMRYGLAHQALHGHDVAHPQWDISARVQRALDRSQEAQPASAVTFKQRILRPLTSLAIAASVALTVVVGGRQLTQLDSSTPYDERITGRYAQQPRRYHGPGQLWYPGRPGLAAGEPDGVPGSGTATPAQIYAGARRTGCAQFAPGVGLVRPCT